MRAKGQVELPEPRGPLAPARSGQRRRQGVRAAADRRAPLVEGKDPDPAEQRAELAGRVRIGSVRQRDVEAGLAREEAGAELRGLRFGAAVSVCC